MSEQLIISVSREYGSGGHEIAQKLAEYYDDKHLERDADFISDLTRRLEDMAELMEKN